MTFYCEDCKHIEECEPHKDNPQSLGCCDFGLFDDEGLIEDWDIERSEDCPLNHYGMTCTSHRVEYREEQKAKHD